MINGCTEIVIKCISVDIILFLCNAAKFDYQDPLNLDGRLTDEEKMVR